MRGVMRGAVAWASGGLVLLSVVLVLSCGGGTEDDGGGADAGPTPTPDASVVVPGTACTSDAACGAGLGCHRGTCRERAPCAAGETEVEGHCYPSACGDAGACSGSNVCVGERCGDPRCGNADCGAQVCDPTTGTCRCPGGQATETTCGDGEDNDCDGVADCADSDCTGLTCRAAGGVCDAAEVCIAGQTTCPADAVQPTSVTCRLAADGAVCDVAEQCGGGKDCPADGFQQAGTTCRASTGVCDPAETCTGTSAECPADALAQASTVCRPAAGACDVAEWCSGSSSQCPADQLAPPGTVCNGSLSGPCDAVDVCTGASVACQPRFAPAGASCTDNNVCTTEACNGLGACATSAVPNGTECGETDPTTCTTPECTNGSCEPREQCLPGWMCCGDGSCTRTACF